MQMNTITHSSNLSGAKNHFKFEAVALYFSEYVCTMDGAHFTYWAIPIFNVFLCANVMLVARLNLKK